MDVVQCHFTVYNNAQADVFVVVKYCFHFKKEKNKKIRKKEPQKLKANHNMCDDAPDQNNIATFFHF